MGTTCDYDTRMSVDTQVSWTVVLNIHEILV